MVVGGGEGVGEGEYTVPTPVYPSLTRTNNILTKSDIISMYCRER